jgi:hypothetical protein
MKLAFQYDAEPNSRKFGEVDLGEPGVPGRTDESYQYFSAGDTQDGNIYLIVDGVEWGSLFLVVNNGKLEISLGQYNVVSGDWDEATPLKHPVTYDPEENA